MFGTKVLGLKGKHNTCRKSRLSEYVRGHWAHLGGTTSWRTYPYGVRGQSESDERRHRFGSLSSPQGGIEPKRRRHCVLPPHSKAEVRRFFVVVLPRCTQKRGQLSGSSGVLWSPRLRGPLGRVPNESIAVAEHLNTITEVQDLEAGNAPAALRRLQ